MLEPGLVHKAFQQGLHHAGVLEEAAVVAVVVDTHGGSIAYLLARWDYQNITVLCVRKNTLLVPMLMHKLFNPHSLAVYPLRLWLQWHDYPCQCDQ